MKTIRNIVLVVAAIIVATTVSFAQSYSLTPNDTIKIVGMMEDLETLSIQQINTSTTSITFLWQKISEIVPEKWEATVCDNAYCRTTLEDSGVMNPVEPTDYGLLLLHITPHVNYGTAIVRYAVWDSTNPLQKDTLTYILIVKEASGIVETFNSNLFSIFPNPSQDNITISTFLNQGYKYLILDEAGNNVQAGHIISSSMSIDTKNLPSGMYSMSILDDQKIVMIKKIIVQH